MDADEYVIDGKKIAGASDDDESAAAAASIASEEDLSWGTLGNLALISSAYCLGFSNVAATLAGTAIASKGMLERDGADTGLATLAIGLQNFGAVLSSPLVAVIMMRYGRRVGFLLCCSMACLGTSIDIAAIFSDSLVALCIGSFFIGVGQVGTQLLRFAATEIVCGAWKPRAASAVLVGGLVGAFLGPEAVKATRWSFADHDFGGMYVAMLGFAIGQGILLCLIDFTAHGKQRAGAGTADDGGEEVARATFPCKSMLADSRGEAMLLSACSYSVMVAVMVPTPLQMQNDGYSFDDSTTVIQLHLIGMFAPSFFTGDIIKWTGARPVALCGCGLIAVSFAVLLIERVLWTFFFALVLLGVGWNYGFIGATVMLSDACPVEHKERVQGMNDMIYFTLAAFGTLFSATLVEGIGWDSYMWLAIGYVVLLVAVATALRFLLFTEAASHVASEAPAKGLCAHVEEPSAGPGNTVAQQPAQQPATQQDRLKPEDGGHLGGVEPPERHMQRACC